MKIIIGIILILFLSIAPVLAAPFLVCDPQAGVTNYKLTGPAWLQSNVPAQSDGSLLVDAAGATVGNNSLTVAACINDPVWGEACSDIVPFSFTRPAPPAKPAGIGLKK